MKTILFSLLTLLFVSTGAIAQQRNVHWIHGLGGNGNSWDSFSGNFFQERQIVVNTSNTYPTGNGVGGMVQSIRNQIGFGADPTSIAICHSMGGVAGRQIDVQNNGRFGGVITFGSPLRGARVVNNVNNQVAVSYIANAINKLRAGPLAQVVPIPVLSIALLSTSYIDEFAGEFIVQSQRDDLNLTQDTSNDLAEESGYNQGFYGNTTATPKLVYWGNEVSPIHVRLAAGSKNQNEQSWVNTWNEVRQEYGWWRDFNHTMRWVQIALYPLYNWRGNEWAEGYNYLYDQSENEWANLIGAGFTFTQQVTQYEFVGSNFDDYNNCLLAAGSDPTQQQICENIYFQWVTRDITFFVRDPSDGLVPRRSQIAQGTAWTANAEVRELPNNSHNEMRRSPESLNELTDAFNGNRSGGAFFIPFR